jgi:predicted O-methyltransferase YrrM
MTQQLWSTVDDYISDQLLPPDPVLDDVVARSATAGLPPIAVAPNQGRFLNLLARLAGAKSILEIGTLGGYSAVWLGRALPPDGRMVTLEANAKHAAVARENIAAAGLAEIVDVRVGPALELLPTVDGPFDLIFIDADKANCPDYFRWALRLSRPGTGIVTDNVVRAGAIADPSTKHEDVLGVRRMHELIAAEPRVEATVVQTVGAKGHDGFSLTYVTR